MKCTLSDLSHGPVTTQQDLQRLVQGIVLDCYKMTILIRFFCNLILAKNDTFSGEGCVNFFPNSDFLCFFSWVGCDNSFGVICNKLLFLLSGVLSSPLHLAGGHQEDRYKPQIASIWNRVEEACRCWRIVEDDDKNHVVSEVMESAR